MDRSWNGRGFALERGIIRVVLYYLDNLYYAIWGICYYYRTQYLECWHRDIY
jgi:hypothetical protein